MNSSIVQGCGAVTLSGAMTYGAGVFVLLLHGEGDDDVDGRFWVNSVMSNDVIVLILTNLVTWEDSPNFRTECGCNDSCSSNFR